MNNFDASRIAYLKALLINSYAPVFSIVEAIVSVGGKALLVGGAVRDLLLAVEVKDIDIEVHGIASEQLEKILRAYGPVDLVGKSFGVYRLHQLDVDWSLPRTDSEGRKPFVKVDPYMKIEDAFRRRDLTINAIGIDLHTFELIDPFNGVCDIQNNCLRSPDTQFFIQDPLRFFRVMQFIGRFEMRPDDTLQELCKTMCIAALSKERVHAEFAKLFLKSRRPSLGIRWLLEIGRLKDVLPELHATVSVIQDPEWHLEGDVFEHTMQTIDAAAALSQKYQSNNDRLILCFAALCHDLGKAETTTFVEGHIKTPGHDQVGMMLAKKMVQRITANKEIQHAVVQLVENHMAPLQFIKSEASVSRYKRLASRLKLPVTMALLADLFCADRQGRNKDAHEPLQTIPKEVTFFGKMIEQAGVLYGPEEPVLTGKDIVHLVQPGPLMGKALQRAYELQIQEGVKDRTTLLNYVLNWHGLKDNVE